MKYAVIEIRKGIFGYTTFCLEWFTTRPEAESRARQLESDCAYQAWFDVRQEGDVGFTPCF
jgi:hypothetical protein